MQQKRPRHSTHRGPKAFERLLADLLRDRQALCRIADALARHTPDPHDRRGHEGCRTHIRQELETLDGYLERVRECLEGDEGHEGIGEDSFIDPSFLAEVRARRRKRRRFDRALPDRWFAGVPLVSAEADAARVAKIERKGVPTGSDAESALLQLPTPWLKAIGRLHEARGNASRAWLAATSAHPLYYSPHLGALLDRFVEQTHVALLARVTAAGRLPEEFLSEAERAELRVDLEWRAPATGAGARLRQLGVLFVGSLDGRRTLYVPENARPYMAAALIPRLPACTTTLESRCKQRLVSLSGPAVQRQAREDAYHDRQVVPVPGLPSRCARLRRPTPGPDRVVDLEIVVRDQPSRVLRRVLTSYQRSLGALHEVLLLTLGLEDEHAPLFLGHEGGPRCEAWSEPRRYDRPSGTVSQWTVSIRDALKRAGGHLVYVQRGEPLVDVRLVGLHAPERVRAEPRVVWAEGARASGCAAHDVHCQETVDAANLFLERLDG